MAFQTAEVLKKRYGMASPALVEKNFRMRVPALPEVGNEMVITAEELAEVIEIKLREILAPLMEDL